MKGKQIRKSFLIRLTEYTGHYRKVTENSLEATKRMFPANMLIVIATLETIIKIMQKGSRKVEIKRIKYCGS